MKHQGMGFLFLALLVGSTGQVVVGQSPAGQARQMKLSGATAEAGRLLEQAVKQFPRDANVLAEYAQFLDTHRDPRARDAYARVLAANPDEKLRRDAARRLAQLDLLAGEPAAAQRRLAEAGLPAPNLPSQASPAGRPSAEVEIPGPLRSFSRMAALSPDLSNDQVLLALARNVVTNGYQAVSGSESLEPTEYLKLVIRYLGQARELARFSGQDQHIRIENCDSAQTGELLRILGFRMRGACGGDVVLETVNATRAFLTMDSGFPLAELEEALRTSRPFVYDFRPTRVAVLYSADYWLSSKERSSGEFIDAFLADPALCRLYLGVAKLDPATADAIRQSMPAPRIRAFAHVFDFFGGMFRLRDGKATVPGGARSAAAWAELVGVPPDQGAAFIERLVMKDDGWMASYFDSLMRIQGPTLDYLTEPNRMKRFYSALRGRVTSPGPARPVFRANTDLMLLTARLRVVNGQPHIPGSLDVWKRLFVEHPNGKYDGKLTKAASGWKEPDELIEALFGLSRKAVENEPLKIFLALSDLDRDRPKPLEAATVETLIRSWRTFGAQYPLLNETPLADATILKFLQVAELINKTRDPLQRSDSAGLAQSLSALWQIFVRHGLIPERDADGVLASLLGAFDKVSNDRDLFDAGRQGLGLLLKATGAPENVNPQDRVMELLAGAVGPTDGESQSLLLGEMNRIFEAQRLVSLKVLFDLADHLESVSKGERLNSALLNRLATRVSDLNLPKSSLTSQERTSFSFGYWTEKHIDAQRKLNFRAVIDRAAGQPEKLREARGLLAPLLRDTLVGLLYVHYAPPGAQVLLTNPLFARSHDFIGMQGANQTWKTTEVLGTGWPSSAGGRLVGSLAGLPYALAEAEQNFLIPTREQALIWGDLVPQMLVSAKLPRWWNATPAQLRWISLQMQLGEAWLVESVLNPGLRESALDSLERLAPPARVQRVAAALTHADLKSAIEEVTPAEFYHMGLEAMAAGLDLPGGLAQEIRAVAEADPAHCNERAVSNLFGTPKPTLASSLKPQLLKLRTFPTLMGYSSRILAESWESNNLFFAALADEMAVPPSRLNLLIPEWTQKTIEQIFATHLEDWPALLRSMRVIADDLRAENRKRQPLQELASQE